MGNNENNRLPGENAHIPSAGKSVDMGTMPLGPRHYAVTLVASLGQFIGQGLATLVGIIIPLMQMAVHPGLSAGMQGFMGCVSLIGIMVGTVVIGRLGDRFGYLLFFRLCPLVMALASLLAVFVHSLPVLLVCLFVLGFAVGGEYSLDSDYISELMPVKWRITMVGVAKALASAGSAFVAAVCYHLLKKWGVPLHWPDLFLIITAVASLMLLLRIPFAQSPEWLMQHGRKAEARKALTHFLGADVTMQTPSRPVIVEHESMLSFIKGNMSKIVLTGIPWACEGLGVYGIGIFLPILIMSFHISELPATATEMERLLHSVGMTFALSIVMMVGFAIGLSVLRKVNHLKLQCTGFWFSAIGLGVLLTAYLLHMPAWVAVAGFVVFELFLNAGPHLVTFILPAQVYPVGSRGTGTGIAAGLGKAGAVFGAFIIPVLLKSGGVVLVMIVSIAVMIAGALITTIAGRKVAGLNESAGTK